MSSTVIINQSNVVAGTNNTIYKYKFNKPVQFKDKAIALNSMQIYYSWYNINATLYNNHQISYVWFDSTGAMTDTRTITIQDGNYSVESLNLYIQNAFLLNGHYLYDSNTKQNIFFIAFSENATYYAVQLDIAKMYITGSLPSGVTIGKANGSSVATWALPSTAKYPQVVFSSTGQLKTLLGFNTGSYPTSSDVPSGQSAYRITSPNVPLLYPVSSVIMRCNACVNNLSDPNDVLFTFSQGTKAYGDIIDIEPNNLNYQTIPNGSYTDITISMYDQNFNSFYIKDSQLIIILIIQDLKDI